MLAGISILPIAAVFTVYLYVASFVTQYLGRPYVAAVAAGTVLVCAFVARDRVARGHFRDGRSAVGVNLV
jgi:hypothetical protein